MWLIQGMFQQEREWLGARMVPIEGMIAVIERGVVESMFCGVLHPESEGLTSHQGSLLDQYGESLLYDVVVSDGEVSFVKAYRQREDTIQYHFYQKVGNIWIGEYDGEATGKGFSSCVLTEIDPLFFDSANLFKSFQPSPTVLPVLGKTQLSQKSG